MRIEKVDVACGVGGDVFNFVMRKENLDFREALQMLAKDAGVNLEENEADPSADQRTKLYELNELTTTYFQEILRHHPAAQAARDYLERRGIVSFHLHDLQPSIGLLMTHAPTSSSEKALLSAEFITPLF